MVELFHRGVKQCCGIERSMVRRAKKVFNHICLSIRAFLRLELQRLITGISWYEAKLMIIRPSIAYYLKNPVYKLSSTA
ncbi:MAG: hypothetical protein ACP5MB_11620 [bacterium]